MVELLILFLAWLFRGLRREIDVVVGDVGVPSSLEEVEVVAERLHPRVSEFRRRIARQQFRLLKHEGARHGLDVWVPKARPYPFDATYKMVARAAGLDGSERPSSPVVDDGRRKGADPSVRRRPASVEEFKDRVEEGARRHSEKVAKDMVMDTADANLAFDLDDDDGLDLSDFDDAWLTEDDYWVDEEERDYAEQRRKKRPRDADVIRLPVDYGDGRGDTRPDRGRAKDWRKAKPGVVLGWARVLRGTENCGFCAMLASRGPVYDSAETAGFAGMSDRGVRGSSLTARQVGQKYHENCDCDVVMVVKGQPWEGEAEFRRLKDLWNDARDNPNEYELGLMRADEPRLVSPFARFRSRVNRILSESPDAFTPGATVRALDSASRISS